MDKWIVLDLDDTLCDFKEPMYAELQKRTGIDLHWENWDTYFLSHRFQMSPEDFCNIIIEAGVLDRLEPYSKTLETLTTAKDAGYNVSIVTARSYHPEALKITQDWLAKYKLPYDELHISQHGISKTEYVKHYEDIKLFVDDRTENCEDFLKLKSCEKVRLFDMPWNKKSGIEKISSICEVIKLL
jgi:5'(3')-deoxyribonucleotidase